MARLDVSATKLTRDGISITPTVYITTDGASVTNDKDTTFLYLSNTDALAIVLTFHIYKTVDDQAVANKTVSIDAGEVMILGPFPASIYNQANAQVYVDAATADKVTIQAFYVE